MQKLGHKAENPLELVVASATSITGTSKRTGEKPPQGIVIVTETLVARPPF